MKKVFFLLVILNLCIVHTFRKLCPNISKCKCFTGDGFIKADCSRSKIRNDLPIVPNNTTFFDLSHNKIRELNLNNLFPTFLRYLDLSYNNLTWIFLGAFDKLINLTWLNMKHNYLSYTDNVFTPGIFRPLQYLKYLNIKDNNILDWKKMKQISSYPESISDLKSLLHLHIDSRRFASFPARFQNLRNLMELDMSCSSAQRKKGFGKYEIDQEFFRNILNLEIFNMSGCDIRSIELGTFSVLSNLRVLNISNNRKLSFRALKNITFGLNETKIHTIDASWLHCEYGVTTMIYKEDLENLKSTNLKIVHIDANRMVRFGNGALACLPHTVEKIYAGSNVLQPGSYITELIHLSNLTYLDISQKPHVLANLIENEANLYGNCHDFRGDLSSATFREGDHIFEKRIGFNLKREIVGKLIIPIPQNLRALKLSNAVLQIPIPELNFTNSNTITDLELKNNLFTSWIGPIGPFNSLKVLDLSSNYCKNVSVHFFDRMTNISALHIEDNFLGFWFAFDESVTTFKHLHNLILLDMSKNRLRYLPHRIFSSQTQLQVLKMSYNIIGVLNISISHMHQLRILDLSNNLITTISVDMRKQIDEIKRFNPKLKISLNDNCLQCSCKQLDELKWFLSNRYTFKRFTKYKCSFENGTEISFKHLHKIIIAFERDCPSYLGIIFSAVSFLSLSLAILVGGLSYRYRWKIRYMYYIFKSKQENTNPRQFEQLYDYDAFVSYSEIQRRFVIDNLRLKLETENGMRLCLHDRDFIPGKDIATNITSAIHRSRRTLIVLSKSFLESNWCIFEFNMARMEEIYARERRHSVLYVVLYENIPTKNLPLQLLELIERQSYIEYPNDEQGNVVFWNKLASSIVG